MPDTANPILIAHWQVKVAGTALQPSDLQTLGYAEIDLAWNKPAMAVLDFHDPDLELLAANKFALGAELEVLIEERVEGAAYTSVFKGEIVALQPEFDNQQNKLQIIAYDKLHRLARGRKTRTFLQATDSDAMSQAISSSGAQLSPSITATSVTHELIWQDNISDLEFILQLANRNTYVVWIEGATVNIKAPAAIGAAINLKYGESLFYFRPRLTAAHQVKKVSARWWDMKTKQPIVEEKSTSNVNAPPSTAAKKGTTAAALFGDSAEVVFAPEIATQGVAAKYAQARLDEHSSAYFPAEGRAFGDAQIKPGAKLNISQVGTMFGGEYVVTSAKHIYGVESGYEVEFTVEGTTGATIGSLIAPPPEPRSHWYGIYPAIVTNNNDPDNMGRVKLKFPWLNPDLESFWARVVYPGAGATRGLMIIPEVSDEVYVVFEHGSINYPVVVGSLWNGEDAMPAQTSAAVKDGKVVQRMLKTRTGHTLTFDDDDNKSGIEIKDKDGLIVRLDGKNKKIEIINDSEKMTFDAQGKKIDIESGGKITIKGTNVEINGESGVVIKGATVKIN